MIFHILVVDDEATMRKGIANFMNWDSIDCKVIGTASDGLEAIEFLKQHPVDIVITDIKMPAADGLEVAKYVYEHCPETKVILLTGYADFSYAQTAIRYNVSSFILKPTNKKSLFEAVQEAQKELIVSRKNSSIAKEELAFLKDQLLQEMTDQPYSSHFESRLSELGFSLCSYYVAAFQPFSAAEHSPSAISEDVLSLKRTIIEEKKNAYCYRYNNLIITVYFVPEPTAVIPLDILNNCREIIAIAGTFGSHSISAGSSDLHCGPEEFGTAVSQAIYSLSFNFYSESSISLFSDIPETDIHDLTAENSMDLVSFENSMNAWQFQAAQNTIQSIFRKFKRSLTNSGDAKNICSQIYYICSRVLLKKNLPAPSGDFLSQIHHASDIFSLEETIRELTDFTSGCLLGESTSQNRLIASAIQYIHSHLAEPLSLESIAEQLHISPSYLSRTFKKICQESLTEFINKTRVEKAKEYLKSSDTLTYEIAELVGYNDPTYFSSIFKRYTGMSPTEYRQG